MPDRLSRGEQEDSSLRSAVGELRTLLFEMRVRVHEPVPELESSDLPEISRRNSAEYRQFSGSVGLNPKEPITSFLLAFFFPTTFSFLRVSENLFNFASRRVSAMPSTST